MTVWTPHSDKQERAILSEAKITAVTTGIQWGKTRVGAIRQKRRMHTYTDPRYNFIIAAPTYKIMQQSTLPAFLGIMGDCGTYSKAEACFTTHWGTHCWMRTGTEPDSVVGITDVKGVWGDEAGKFSLYFKENLEARAAFLNCQVDYTTSPYALNWIFKEIIRPKMKDAAARTDVEWIHASSIENPFFPQAEYERQRMNMDPRRFSSLYGGNYEKMAGLVYDVFDEIENSCDPFTLPSGTKFIGGVDEGFTNPFCLKVRGITPDGRHFNVFEFYKSGQSLAQKIEVARQAKAIFGTSKFLIDPSAASLISAFNEAKLTAVPADNDIRAGIDAHYELVKTRRFKVFRGTSPYTMDEYEGYHYPDPDDAGPDDDVKEDKPVKQADHAMDVDRYISLATHRPGNRKPRYPGDDKMAETRDDRLARLKRPSREDKFEKWSA